MKNNRKAMKNHAKLIFTKTSALLKQNCELPQKLQFYACKTTGVHTNISFTAANPQLFSQTTVLCNKNNTGI